MSKNCPIYIFVKQAQAKHFLLAPSRRLCSVWAMHPIACWHNELFHFNQTSFQAFKCLFNYVENAMLPSFNMFVYKPLFCVNLVSCELFKL